ncbi:MAG TPA: hypothetical protein VGF67_08975 [Ktedonobacteraceae bacterium]
MGRTRTRIQQASLSAVIVEVQLRQGRQACWIYAWDRERARLCVQGVASGQQNLPADLAALCLGQQQEVPVYVLVSQSIVPGAAVPVRILGGFQASSQPAGGLHTFPLAHAVLIATPDLSGLPPLYETLEHIPCALLSALQAHACTLLPAGTQLLVSNASQIASRLREARLWLKRSGRTRQKEAPAVAWRAVGELTTEQRSRIAGARSIEALTPLLQAEQLIHFVPARFQKSLGQILLDDERLLAFLERPLSQRRAGLRRYRAQAGLLLLTDRQVLWLRDFFSPGSATFPQGYIARSVPLERIVDVWLLPAGESGPDHGSCLQLHIKIESSKGCQDLEIAFPHNETCQQALRRIVPLLRAFVAQDASSERRVRCLPIVAAWFPYGEEARKLAALERIVPVEQRQRLEQGLAEALQVTGEEVLALAAVPALEQYRSPAVLVALTRTAVHIFALPVPASGQGRSAVLQVQRYPLAQISSVQLSYSLLSSDLRLSLPQADGTTRECLIPFHSPAVAWFLPLFTRLRQALRVPLPQD